MLFFTNSIEQTLCFTIKIFPYSALIKILFTILLGNKDGINNLIHFPIVRCAAIKQRATAY